MEHACVCGSHCATLSMDRNESLPLDILFIATVWKVFLLKMGPKFMFGVPTTHLNTNIDKDRTIYAPCQNQ